MQLNICTFLGKRLFDTTKAAQAGNAGVPFKKVLEEARYLSLPRAKVRGWPCSREWVVLVDRGLMVFWLIVLRRAL